MSLRQAPGGPAIVKTVPAIHSKLIAEVTGLSMHCPYDQGNPEHCPLHRIRLLPMPARIHWVRTCPDTDMRAIVQYHFNCIANKEKRAPDRMKTGLRLVIST